MIVDVVKEFKQALGEVTGASVPLDGVQLRVVVLFDTNTRCSSVDVQASHNAGNIVRRALQQAGMGDLIAFEIGRAVSRFEGIV